MIGVLIAVSINDWNEERQQKNVLKGIFAVFINDIKQDTTEVSQLMDYYKKREPTFLKIGSDSLTEKEISECDLCQELLSSRELFAINKRGIFQLNDYNNYTLSSQDSLVFRIVNFYATLVDKIEGFNELINDDIMGNLAYWRDNYPLFPSLLEKKLSSEDLKLLVRSQEYRNRAALYYVLIYENYLPMLQGFQNDSRAILKQLNERVNQN